MTKKNPFFLEKTLALFVLRFFQDKQLNSYTNYEVVNYWLFVLQSIARLGYYFLIMIFNSISKEINNHYPRPHLQKNKQYQHTHYVPTDTLKNYNLSKNMDYMVPERESALSQMNQKITENLQYLKYKDYMRQKDLHSSRVSSSSNRSHRSSRTHHNHTNSRLSLQSPSRNNHILTKKSEHYFPQVMQTKLSAKPWQTQATSLHQPVQSTTIYREGSEYRQFLRKPITIDHYNEKYGLTTKQPDNTQSILTNSNNTYRTKKSDYSSGREQFQMQQQTFASPMSKDFVNALGKQPKVVKRVQLSTEDPHEKVTSRVAFREQKQNQAKVSPLEVAPKPSNKSAVIIAAGLIGLGLLLLILQALK